MLVAEVIGSIVTGSLALLVDAAHMLTDAGGLGLKLAIRCIEDGFLLTRSLAHSLGGQLAATADEQGRQHQARTNRKQRRTTHQSLQTGSRNGWMAMQAACQEKSGKI